MDLSPSVKIICTTPIVLKTESAAQTSSTMVIDPINHLGKKEEEERIGQLNGQVKLIKDELKWQLNLPDHCYQLKWLKSCLICHYSNLKQKMDP